ncbi:MAG: hypothetical protein KJ967_03540 [Elusimicrobia bacterium]|nr:hypothetical protein [Elusimicrobiota bacterium]
MYGCKVVCFFVILACMFSGTFASETMDTARQIEKGKARVVFYNSSFKNSPVLKVRGTGNVRITQGYEYATDYETEVNCSGYGNQTVLKVSYNPFEGLIWWGKIGSADYRLDVPSTSYISTSLVSSSPGLMSGIGARYLIFPETVVTPALGADFSLTLSEIRFDRAYQLRFETAEGQIAFIISKTMSVFEPYGGIKVYRSYSKITDTQTFESTSGYKDNVNLFGGVRVKLYRYEWLIVEGNFIGETGISAGVGLGF